MAEYIIREQAKQAICEYILQQTVSKYPSEELCKASRMGAEGAMYEIDYVPTADVVEVIRCKDCKRCYEKRTKRNNQLMRFCMRMDGNEYQVNANDFCSYGTPKERGGEK